MQRVNVSAVLICQESVCVCVCVCVSLQGSLAPVRVLRWTDGGGNVGLWRQRGPDARCNMAKVGAWHEPQCHSCTSTRRVHPPRLSQRKHKISRRLLLDSCVCSSRDPRLRLAPLRRRSRAHTCTYAHSELCLTSAAEAPTEAPHGGRRALTLGRSVHVSAERRRMERAEEKLWAARREENTVETAGGGSPTSGVDDAYLPQAPPSWNWIPTCGGWGDRARCSAGEVPAFGRYRGGSCLCPVLREGRSGKRGKCRRRRRRPPQKSPFWRKGQDESRWEGHLYYSLFVVVTWRARRKSAAEEKLRIFVFVCKQHIMC